ncbi:type IV / VI secretion system protein, DotU family [Epibacterium ulvae]|uniref:Type IV / VI secretion system protein, DotU family n=2 Tax=Epibacterium ulvae TaxID=1156985 RepID=A0A1G5QI11_9RHOB|nr:type IV / VI secretion system protein, DotU family [Epibacterium ulvae]
MMQRGSDTPTITLTPKGVSVGGGARLAEVSSSDLQTLDRTLSHYKGSQNTLINASADLLAVCATIPRMNPGADLNPTRLELSRAIIDLKYRVAQLDYPPAVAENLCLLFAIALDEFVLVSKWGRESGWENRTLVADLFGFRDGGDRFYHIADRALMQPKALREFLEIIYIFLKLGYRGKYSKSSEHERDRLIDRLETAMNLVPVERDITLMGRPITTSQALGSHMRASRKIGLAVTCIVMVFVLVWGWRYQLAETTYSKFERLRTAAENETAVDFVFSSETGILSTATRE